MAPWSYPVWDFRTGALVIDHAPIRCDSFSDALGVAEGSMSGSLGLTGTPITVDEILIPWRRVITPCYLGQPQGAYVITALAPFGPRSTSVTFTAKRVDVILTKRRIWSTLKFEQADQLDIARSLVAYGIGLSGLPAMDPDYLAAMEALPAAAAIPWLSVDSAMSGVLRDRLDNDSGYQGARNIAVADALAQLSQVEGGFDVRLDYSSGGLAVKIRLGYPRLGRTEPSLPLEWPGNLLDWTFAAAGDDTETESRVFGAGQGAERTITMGAPTIDAAAHALGYPLLMGAENSTASEPDTLAAAGRSRLARFSGLNEGWNLVLGQDQLGRYELGDSVLLRISNPRWGVKREVVRIIGHTVQPSRQGRAGKVVLSVQTP